MTPADFRPRVLVTKIGLDGHDRGSRIVAAACRDAGMEVIYTPPWQSIPAVVKLALEEDVDVVGISSLATDHLIVPKLMRALQDAGLGHVVVVVGGIVPDNEEALLLESGVREVFHPGSTMDDITGPHPQLRRRGAPRGPAGAGLAGDPRMNKRLESPLAEASPQPDAKATWQREYRDTIGTDRAVANVSGIPIQPLYGADDWPAYVQPDPLGYPGQARLHARYLRDHASRPHLERSAS